MITLTKAGLRAIATLAVFFAILSFLGVKLLIAEQLKTEAKSTNEELYWFNVNEAENPTTPLDQPCPGPGVILCAKAYQANQINFDTDGITPLSVKPAEYANDHGTRNRMP